ncbi:hypothetical protein GCM10008995_28790 [Halobellus salinus]|uniref:Piwi domain-containing protein n=1 Tax=Halobellus salinus TaxID=931585 RepID=A0A830EJS7_9EURY|nr:Piwi domain-containing protein [Halobellus salinus]GGJ17147.1 hypothetical protein GCM10008995_28790 [Halobellus salinus]SMP29933.1 Piwi domain-containing protein [Halobellus salinus]
MASHLNAFPIDVSQIDVAIYDISPQPTTPAWNRLDQLEDDVTSSTGGIGVRYHDGDSWKIVACGVTDPPSQVTDSDSQLTLTESTTWDPDTDGDPDVIAEALETGLKDFLATHRGYWSEKYNRVFQYAPYSSEGSYNMHLGYKISVEYANEFQLFLDPTFKFLSQKSLKDWIDQVGIETVQEQFTGERFIMFSSRTSYVTLESIYEDRTVMDDTVYGSTIYELNTESPAPQADDVEETDPLCGVTYSNNPKEYTVSPALLYGTPGSNDVLNESAIITPSQRRDEIRALARDVSFIQVGGQQFGLGDTELAGDIERFQYPALEFGGGHVFDPQSLGDLPDKWEWENEMQRLLSEHGPVSRVRGERHIAFAHPDSYPEVPEETYRDIQEHLQQYAKITAPGPVGPIEYTDRRIWNDWVAQQGDQIDGLLAALAEESDDRYYSLVNDVDGEPVQHFTPSALDEHRDSSLFNVAMGLAAKMGVRPFVLADPLHTDIVIGFDVNGFEQTSIGAVTLDGESGDVITQTTSGFSAGQSTAAPEFETKSALRSQITEAVQEKGTISSVVIHRGGVLKNSEESAIRELIPELVEEGTLPEDVRWGVVEVNADTPHRIFDQAYDLQAPTGSYTTIGGRTGIVVNGGYPYVWQGTPRATSCTLAAANCDWDITALTQDVFRLSFLNWGSPGSVNMRPPISTDLATELAKMFEKCNEIQYLPF